MQRNNHGTPAAVDPTPIIELSTAYWGSQTLLTANRLGVFDVLASAPLSSEAVAGRLDLDARMTEIFLNACVGLGVCEKANNEFSNSKAASVFLVSNSPASMSNSMSFMDDIYSTWGDLESALRSGKPAKAAMTYLGDDK